ncbi:hypothetical protein PLESTB_000336700 [Pleodorina starrii]|uniref:Uncharacterized protein n=1 Tax=Pleodorina starrii TaxID=330485 RepID=A0A9W6BDA9_9CHLO|nr:hypothetical protein PLESTB_000336700 [Pleodorina starrii]GLC70150.1 hypothetical protein PLESTF_000930700 [Pleodorina starrii]
MALGRASNHIDKQHTLILVLVATVTAACGILGRLARPFWVRVQRRPIQKAANCKRGTPLGRVVSECEARWLLGDLQAALNGDAPAVQRVGSMLAAGYGARRQDHQSAASWAKSALALQSYKEPGAEELARWSGSSLRSEPSSEDEQDACDEGDAGTSIGRSPSWSTGLGSSAGLGPGVGVAAPARTPPRGSNWPTALQRRLSADDAVQRKP